MFDEDYLSERLLELVPGAGDRLFPFQDGSRLEHDAVRGFSINCPLGYPNCKISWEGMRVMDLIVHMNDSHKWSFEQIANWLDNSQYDLTVREVENESS